MAKLNEIIKLGTPAKLKKGQKSYEWDGEDLRSVYSLKIQYSEIIFDSDWQLDEPTVEDVLKERNIVYILDSHKHIRIKRSNCQFPVITIKELPTSAAEMIRIIDFLESIGT